MAGVVPALVCPSGGDSFRTSSLYDCTLQCPGADRLQCAEVPPIHSHVLGTRFRLCGPK